MIKKLSLLPLLAFTAGFLSPVEQAAADKLDEIRQRGQMIVAVRADSPRFGSIDPTTNTVSGFEIDIAGAIARKIFGDDIKVEFVPVPQASRIAQLTTERADMVAATLSITHDRLREIDFSNVYLRVGQALLVRKDSDVEKVSDLEGKPVCAPLGTTPEMVIRNLLPNSEILPLNGDPEGLLALKAQRCDAYTTGFLSLMDLAEADDSVKVAGDIFTYETWGLGIKKGNDTFADAVNAALAELAKDGQYDAAYQKWITEKLPLDRDDWLGMPANEAADRYAASIAVDP